NLVAASLLTCSILLVPKLFRNADSKSLLATMLRFLSVEPRASTSFGNASTRESLPVLKSRIAVCFSLLSHLLMTACSSLKVQWFTTWNTAASTGSDGTSAGAFVSGVADAAAGAGLGAALR